MAGTTSTKPNFRLLFGSLVVLLGVVLVLVLLTTIFAGSTAISDNLRADVGRPEFGACYSDITDDCEKTTYLNCEEINSSDGLLDDSEDRSPYIWLSGQECDAQAEYIDNVTIEDSLKWAKAECLIELTDIAKRACGLRGSTRTYVANQRILFDSKGPLIGAIDIAGDDYYVAICGAVIKCVPHVPPPIEPSPFASPSP